MTESQWLNAKHSLPLMEYLHRGNTTERKLYLWTFAVLKEDWASLGARHRDLIEAGLSWVNGDISYEKLQERGDLAGRHIEAAEDAARREAMNDDLLPTQAVKVALAHDIFGNPFQPYPCYCDPDVGITTCEYCDELESWRTATVRDLARLAYSTQDFAHLPVLADALEDAGCCDQAILTHCRAQVVERGCWQAVPAIEKDQRTVIGFQVRWSLPGQDGKYLYVGHYYAHDDNSNIGWCRNAALRDAERKNADFWMPRTMTFDPVIERTVQAKHVRGCWVLDLLLHLSKRTVVR